MNYRLAHGDAVELLRKEPDESVNLVLTSPPYDNMRKYNSNGESFQYHDVGQELSRVLVPGGVAVILIQDTISKGVKSLTSFRMVLDWCDNTELNLFETALYTRQRMPSVHWNTRFREDHDYIHIFVKGSSPGCFNKEHMKVVAKNAGQVSKAVNVSSAQGRSGQSQGEFKVAEFICPGTVQRYTDRNPGGSDHPAVMSNKFASDYIRAFTRPGDTVLDPYVGSGTTVIQSLIWGRNSIGFDLSQKYLEGAQARISSGIQLRVL